MDSFERLEIFPLPEKIVLKDTDGDTRVPYERVKTYDDKEFELFIREWVTSLIGTYEVRGFGGAGDKGRDVIAKDSDGKYLYFQCKHYDHALVPSDIWTEFGKLIYYTFNEEIPIPKAYYIVAPYDIGPTLSDLLDKPETIAKQLLDKWDTHCKAKIVANSIDMSLALQEYIHHFDFSIVKTKSMLEIIQEHKKTAFYAFRFGGGLTVSRDRKISVPEIVEKCELIYIQKMLAAISQKEHADITSVEQLEREFPNYIETIEMNRKRFYHAENLKAFAAKYLLTDDYFNDLTEDIHFGIYDVLEKVYDTGYERFNEVMTQVVQIDLSHNLLSRYNLVHPQDRQGICHQLANKTDGITWVK